MTDFGKIDPNERLIEKDRKSFEQSAALEKAESKDIKDERNIEDENDVSLQVGKPRLKVKKTIIILLLLAAIATTYFALPILTNKETSEPSTEPIVNTLPQPSFIDASEPENKALKENIEAKKNLVNIFEFDINQCLQEYSDDECVDMYDKSLQVNQ